VLRLTLDTNCLIELEQHSAPARFIEELLAAHRAKIIRLCVVAISASERSKNGKFADNFLAFEAKLDELGLSLAEVLLPLCYFDISFLGYCVLADNDALESRIHSILFPQLSFQWIDYCRAYGRDVNDFASDHKWRNAKCDVLALWSHIHYSADVFVTSDANFHKASKRPQLIALGAKEIVTPQRAAGLIPG
jgi:hypothetical protein